ncbi:MAG: hypothetical protein ACLFS0_09835, partial [Bacteroidales bacterium]
MPEHEYILTATPGFNRVIGYQHMYHTKKYLSQCFDRFEPYQFYDTRLARLSECCGGGGWEGLMAFESKFWRWMRGQGKVPRYFLHAIGVDERVLSYVIELDREALEQSIDAPLKLNWFAAIKNDGQYVIQEMPETGCISQAVLNMRAYQRNNPRTDCFMHIGQLYTTVNPYKSLAIHYIHEVSMEADEEHVWLGHIKALTGPNE